MTDTSGSGDHGNQTLPDQGGVDYLAKVKEKFSTAEGEVDVPALSRGKVEADEHIKRLELEMSEMRGQVNSSINYETFLDRLKSHGEENKGTGTPTTPEIPAVVSTNTESEMSGLSQQDVAQLISKQLSERDLESRRKANVEFAIDKMRGVWGNDFEAKVKEAARVNGYDEQFLANTLQQNPQAFLKLVGAPDQPEVRPDPSVFQPPHSSVTPAEANVTRKYSYYQNLRKSDPKKYKTADVQAELHAMAHKMGESFYD